MVGGGLGVAITYILAISSLHSEQTRIATTLENITNVVEDCRVNAYRPSDAERDFALVRYQIGQNAEQIKLLTKMIEHHIEGTSGYRHETD